MFLQRHKALIKLQSCLYLSFMHNDYFSPCLPDLFAADVWELILYDTPSHLFLIHSFICFVFYELNAFKMNVQVLLSLASGLN